MALISRHDDSRCARRQHRTGHEVIVLETVSRILVGVGLGSPVAEDEVGAARLGMRLARTPTMFCVTSNRKRPRDQFSTSCSIALHSTCVASALASCTPAASTAALQHPSSASCCTRLLVVSRRANARPSRPVRHTVSSSVGSIKRFSASCRFRGLTRTDSVDPSPTSRRTGTLSLV